MITTNILEDTQVRYRTRTQERNLREWHSQRLGNLGDWRKVDEPNRIRNRMMTIENESLTNKVNSGFDNLTQKGFLERIIDNSNLLPATFLIQGAKVTNSVGRVVLRTGHSQVVGFGTGFMVSRMLLLTNNHVLESREMAEQSVVQFNYYEQIDGSITNPIQFQLDPNQFFVTNTELDFTLVAISKPDNVPDSQKTSWIPLIRESGKALVGEQVNIIQHPNGKPMQLVLHDNTIIDVFDDFLHYRADTQPGSSGSPVLNNNWQVAALHHSGVPKRDQDGRILLVSGDYWDLQQSTVDQIDWVANEGIRISSIVNFLDQIAMTPSQQRLYEGVFERPTLERISSSQSLNARTPNKTVPSSLVESPKIEADGTVSWYYKVNFGPVENLAAMSARQQHTSDEVPQKQQTVMGISGSSNIPRGLNTNRYRDEARRIVERVETKPYYDQNQDELDRISYYGDLPIQDLNTFELYNQLHLLLSDSHTNPLTYRIARHNHLYAHVDLHESGQLRNIYSGTLLDPIDVIERELVILERFNNEILALQELNTDVDGQEYLDRIYLLEAQMAFNTEHVVPQSWFGKNEPMKSDLHHLFTCDPKCNSFRSNIAYFDFEPLSEAIRDDCGQVKKVENKFEPEMGHGAIARATLYFLLRYPGKFVHQENLMPPERIKILIQWHKMNKVGRYELHRNSSIFKVQGNRNPLIDFPEIVDKIDFDLAYQN